MLPNRVEYAQAGRNLVLRQLFSGDGKEFLLTLHHALNCAPSLRGDGHQVRSAVRRIVLQLEDSELNTVVDTALYELTTQQQHLCDARNRLGSCERQQLEHRAGADWQTGSILFERARCSTVQQTDGAHDIGKVRFCTGIVHNAIIPAPFRHLGGQIS